MSSRENFVQNIDINNIRIENFPGFLFLFGGTPHINNSNGQVPASMRGLVCDELYAKYPRHSPILRMPEEFQDWLHHSNYPNLIEFELDLAELASVVAVIVEASGAIAELGAFCVLDNLRNKLAVISNDYFVADGTFIELGPYKHQESIDEKSVHKFSWMFQIPRANNQPPVLNIDIEDSRKISPLIAKSIIDFYERKHQKTYAFNTKSNGHWMLLISDLIAKMHALKFSEILRCIDLFEGQVDKENLGRLKKKLKQYLFILEKFELIKRKKFGNDTYYKKGDSSSAYIKYAFSSSGGLNSNEISAALLDEYKEDDPYRYTAIIS